jgi:O-antigen/teichoic acid export membrane protein
MSGFLSDLAVRARAGWRDTSIRAGATRALFLPLTSVAALLVAHIQIDAVGSRGYGILTLLVALTLLLPFADLGLGAAVTNAVALRASDARHQRILAASVRLLALGCVAVVVVAAALSATRSWGSITGIEHAEAPTLDRDMLIAAVLFALGLPLGLGGRVLLGLDRYASFVAIQAAVPAVTLAIVFAFRSSSSMTPFLLAPFVAQDVAALVATAVALRALKFERSWFARHRAAVGSVAREIRQTAAPMVLITLGLPVALQSDRLILSHFGTRTDLTRYALVATLYVPAWSIVSSAGMSLWPRFARLGASSRVEQKREYRRLFPAFLAVGVIGAAALVVLGPPATRLWASGEGDGGLALWSSFGLLLAVQAAHLPGAMFLTSPKGLRFQAVCVLLMCFANVPLSVGLASAWGAVGPVLASALTILCLQLLPARRRTLRATE